MLVADYDPLPGGSGSFDNLRRSGSRIGVAMQENAAVGLHVIGELSPRAPQQMFEMAIMVSRDEMHFHGRRKAFQNCSQVAFDRRDWDRPMHHVAKQHYLLGFIR